MIATLIGLVNPALEAGIDVPENFEDDAGFDHEHYIRWVIFVNAQMGRPMPSPTSHWENAKIIAKIPRDRLKKISIHELEQEFHFQ